jgi:hypothetical protein
LQTLVFFDPFTPAPLRRTNLSCPGDFFRPSTGAPQIPVTANISGTWQDTASWANGAVPGAPAIPDIGLPPSAGGSVSSFALTTGSTPVTVAGFDIFDHHATVEITSDTSATAAVINDLAGTLEVTAGNTLTGTGPALPKGHVFAPPVVWSRSSSCTKATDCPWRPAVQSNRSSGSATHG